MWSFLVDLVRNADVSRTVVVMDADEVGEARRYRLEPKWLGAVWGSSLLVVGLVVTGLFAFTPLQGILPGQETEEMRRNAQLTALRVEALEDSVAAQRHYIQRLQQLITGRVDSVAQRSLGAAPSPSSPAERTRQLPAPGTSTADTAASGSAQPRFASPVFQSTPSPESAEAGVGPVFPAEPPVQNGFPTRDFNAKSGHYGVDIAVAKGTSVRAVERGYVVLADWTQDGGYTIAVQHANGYLSVYKHNRRLLKRLGDRVRAQEALAISGNSGEITTGPHLHFELWRNGLAQDPRSFIAAW